MAGSHAAKRKSSAPWILGTVLSAIVIVGLIVGGFVLAGRRSTAVPTTASTVPPATLVVMGTAPSNETTVDSSATIRVSLNQALAESSPLPSISPTLPGSWEHLSPSMLQFVQTSPLLPGQTVTVTVPGGATGVVGTTGAHLASSVVSTFHIAPLTSLRVEQLLAQLGYLPLNFTPSTPSATAGASTAEQPGVFSWRWTNLPTSLTSLWVAGQPNVLLQGAVMRFQDAHGLATDGQAGPQLWSQLLSDAAADKHNPDAYNYVLVSLSTPQHLSVWSNGAVVKTAAVNTGITVSPTDIGTWPVYLRYRTQTMRGTNPDGTKYEDPGVPFVSYFYKGEALHGFIRSSYGTPQSLGCVEMTFADAGDVWPLTPLGTLVTVLP